jgi:methylenetetrahydrofolate dehydrogenase (NADP+)/methenyltetrahydrofolate cyclohydrolase
MKLLNGIELAGYIKERQAKQVRALRQTGHIIPQLAIIQTSDNPVIDIYVRLKKQYGKDINVEVDVYKISQTSIKKTIKCLNDDKKVHGIIVQLPLNDMSNVKTILDSVIPEKDVDGLGEKATLIPATPLAIIWLLAGYNIDLDYKHIVLVGHGRLVGAPLAKLWQEADLQVIICSKNTTNLAEIVASADIIVTATGVPGLIKASMIKNGAVVVDAGTASEQGSITGDLASDVRERDDLTITPEKGGVGPLTVTALFDNVIQAAQKSVRTKT